MGGWSARSSAASADTAPAAVRHCRTAASQYRARAPRAVRAPSPAPPCRRVSSIPVCRAFASPEAFLSGRSSPVPPVKCRIGRFEVNRCFRRVQNIALQHAPRKKPRPEQRRGAVTFVVVAGPKSPLDVPLHPNLRILARRGRRLLRQTRLTVTPVKAFDDLRRHPAGSNRTTRNSEIYPLTGHVADRASLR